MKQFKHYFYVLLLPLMLMLSACGDDDDEPEPAGTSQEKSGIVIKNNSSYDLTNFRVYFIGANSYQTITYENYGTFKTGRTITVTEIPDGAVYYYLATTLGGTSFFSIDYSLSTRRITLTDETVGNWTSNGN